MAVSIRLLIASCVALSLVCAPASAFADEDDGRAKNPLIRAYEELLEESDLDDEEEADSLRKMLREADETLTRIKEENREALKNINRLPPGLGHGKANVVMLLVDDLDPAMIGAYGNKQIRTPALDRIADEGMRFDDFHAGSPRDLDAFWCAVTGRHSGNVPRDNYGRPVMSSPRSSLTSVAWHAGYNTGFFGAWPLDGKHGPTACFAETFVGFRGGEDCRKAYPSEYFVNSATRKVAGKVFAWSLTTMQTLAALERETGSRPFCHVARYHRVDLPAAEMAGLKLPRNLSNLERSRAARNLRFDRELARILNHLDRKGQRDNTLVIVAGETPLGWHDHETDVIAKVAQPALRAPLLVRWPKVVRAGRVSEQLCSASDLVPTLATILRDSRYSHDASGESLYSALTGNAKSSADRLLYWRVPVESGGVLQAVRLGDWKAIVEPGADSIQLYDLAQDPGETKDVSANHPDVLQKVLRPGG